MRGLSIVSLASHAENRSPLLVHPTSHLHTHSLPIIHRLLRSVCWRKSKQQTEPRHQPPSRSSHSDRAGKQQLPPSPISLSVRPTQSPARIPVTTHTSTPNDLNIIHPALTPMEPQRLNGRYHNNQQLAYPELNPSSATLYQEQTVRNRHCPSRMD